MAIRWWAFVLLVILGASRWIFAAASLGPTSALASEFLGTMLAGALAFGILLTRGAKISWSSGSPTRRIRLLTAGAMFFTGPEVALLLHPHGLSAAGFAMSMSLTPVVVAITASALEPSAASGVGSRVWPGLATLAGLLMLFAEPSLHDIGTDITYVLAPLLTGVGAVLFSADQEGSGIRAAFLLAGGGITFAVALAVSSIWNHPFLQISLVAIILNGVLALLGITALLQLGPVRWSAQFSIVPLLIVLEGILMLRSALVWRGVAGLALLSISSAYLLLGRANGQKPGEFVIR